MRHALTFENGVIEMHMLPMRAVADISDLAGGKLDTSDLNAGDLRKLMALIDEYIDHIRINGYDDTVDSLTDCPARWGMEALEAILGFTFPEAANAESDTSSSASSPTTRTRQAVPTSST